MNILIDTHIAIWLFTDHSKFEQDFIDIIEDLNNRIYVSLISIWEVAIKNIKYGNDKMPIGEKLFIKYCEEMEFEFLPIRVNHILNIRNLKIKDENIIHKDPFDKLLISQSICEKFTLYTRDTGLLNYNVNNIKII